MIELVLPQTNGEWLAWAGAAYLVINGLLKMLVPGLWVKFFKSQIAGNNGYGAAMLRGPMGGGNLGLGLAVLVLHPQPLLYMAIGCMFVFMAVGRLISILADRSRGLRNWISFIIEIFLGYFSLDYAIGLTAYVSKLWTNGTF